MGGCWPSARTHSSVWRRLQKPTLQVSGREASSCIAFVRMSLGQPNFHEPHSESACRRHQARKNIEQINYAFERIIAPVMVRGQRRKAVITVGKPGIFGAVDAATGQFLFAKDPGTQNVATAIDPVTGVKTLLPKPPPSITCRSSTRAWEKWAKRRPASWRST